MSSRLMTMKFMQRAAASSATPSPQSPLTPNSAPSSKRRKTSTDQSPLPSTPNTDAQIFQAAVDAEDAKRAAAIERVATQAGETKWVLSTTDRVGKSSFGEKKLQFLTAGYSDIDQDIETSGRRTFGRYRHRDEVGFKCTKQQDGTADSDTDSLSENEENSNNPEDTGTNSEDGGGSTVDDSIHISGNKNIGRAEDNTQIPRKRKSLHKADANNAGMRTQQKVKLNKLASISGGGGGRSSGGGLAGMECHFCGERGHKKADCPKKLRQERRRENR
ncbi:MAG: hypothetical protein Q9169_002037 [Polycauliona sp. 2 TL-2023]